MKKQKKGTQENVKTEADTQREVKDLQQTKQDVKGGKKSLIGNFPR